MATTPYIQVKDISKSFGDVVALEHVSFDIENGEIVALIGPNGAGKSTLASIIMGLLEPTSGSITIDGAVPSEKRTAIGYVPQRFTFNQRVPITVGEFLSLSLHVAGVGEQSAQTINTWLKRVGLPTDTLQKQLGELSGGQRQRVLIARALLTHKQLLIMDEPVAGLDVEGKESIHSLLKSLNKEHGVTVILISHELDVVYNYADKVLCLHRKLLCHGKPREALTSDVLTQMYEGEHAAHYHHGCTHKE